MSVLAIIPARGGSKEIPRKNVRLLAGKPLISRTIKCAQLAESVNRIVVSTDDPEIADISKQNGAEIIWRPANISDDSSSSEMALLHSLEYLQNQENFQPEILVFLQCTSPLTLPEDIDGTVNVLLKANADSAFAATPFHYFLWTHDKEGNPVGINHDQKVRLLRQNREPQFLETGAVYSMRAEGFKKVQHRFFGKIAIYVMPPDRCFEIDEPVDFIIAENLLKHR
ncbi:acylneuraminate cytidylyltransferase family protein [candidate division KSB1 bacterium]|nr:acylneuraminate cytidylyltransferase family protein [candidate division KSB1 bacterium]